MGLNKSIFFTSIIICLFSSCWHGEKFIPSSTEPVQSNFELYSGLIFINAEVNGVSGTFLFDNGFSENGINQSFAEKAKLTFKGSTTIRDANNKVANTATSVADLVEIQGQKFTNSEFSKINTDRFFPCRKIDGVIGASIINKANWKINFESQTLWISSKPFKGEGFPMKINFTSNNSSIAEISAFDKTYRCKVDLGSYETVKLRLANTEKSFEGLLAEEKKGMTSLSVQGLGNVESDFQLKEPIAIKHGDKTLPLLSSLKLKQKLKYQGYLGINFFKPYLLIINSDNKKYWLSQQSAPIALKDSSYGLGIYQIKDTWRVIQVNPKDTLVSNVQLMSEVAMVDSLPMSSFETICDYRSFIKKKAKERSVLKVTLKEDNQVIKVPYHEKVYGKLVYQ